MQAVKIKNINKSYMKKPFVVKGRIKYLNVENNKKSNGSHLNAIVIDESSEIEVVAFENCESISKLLKVNNIVTIENGILREVNKDYKKTKHKYQIILKSSTLITIINNEAVNGDFPINKYTSGSELKTLTTGMIIDVIGICEQLDNEKTVNAQNQVHRKGQISIDSTSIEVRFSGDKIDGLYHIGDTLFLTNIKYVNYKGTVFLSVGNSSFVKCNQQQLSNGFDTEQLQQLEKFEKKILDSTIGLSEHKPSTSSITQPNNNSTIELPEHKLLTSSMTQSFRISDLADESIDQRPSTSGSTSSNKRKTQDFKGEEVNSKILKITEPESEESFSDERFLDMVVSFMQNVNNNKHVIQLRILEFISKILEENKKKSS